MPKETIVSPINTSDILNFLAILLAPFTSISAPNINKIKPNTINKNLKNIIITPIYIINFTQTIYFLNNKWYDKITILNNNFLGEIIC